MQPALAPISRRGHYVCLQPAKDGIYPARAETRIIDWDESYEDYAPFEFVTDKVLAQGQDRNPKGYADPNQPPDKSIIMKRGSHELLATRKPFRFDSQGRPLNPRGRTGLTNRGRLGKWGPNFAGDAIVTRWNPDRRSILEFVAIKRKDTGQWAIPGGMTEPHELAAKTLRREFREEAVALTAGAKPEEAAATMRRFEELLEGLFSAENGRVVYRGYGAWPHVGGRAVPALCARPR